MAKVLVEIDIHAGLPEILEIEWRGLLIAQPRLPGNPFSVLVLSKNRPFEKRLLTVPSYSDRGWTHQRRLVLMVMIHSQI
jgi:hypothetical protein